MDLIITFLEFQVNLNSKGNIELILFLKRSSSTIWNILLIYKFNCFFCPSIEKCPQKKRRIRGSCRKCILTDSSAFSYFSILESKQIGRYHSIYCSMGSCYSFSNSLACFNFWIGSSWLRKRILRSRRNRGLRRILELHRGSCKIHRFESIWNPSHLWRSDLLHYL